MREWVDDTSSVQVNKLSTETSLNEDLLEPVKCQQNMLEHQQKQIDILNQIIPRNTEAKTIGVAAVQAIQGATGSLQRNIFVIDTLSEVKNGKIPVLFLNLGNEDICLKVKSSIGTKVEIIKSIRDHYMILLKKQKTI